MGDVARRIVQHLRVAEESEAQVDGSKNRRGLKGVGSAPFNKHFRGTLPRKELS
jgi:hypothetical protein